MNYYIDDYDFEKHDLLIEEGDKEQSAGVWADQPQLTFYEGNIVKIAYSLSLVNNDVVIMTFYNDLFLHAKNKHRLSSEEIGIFLLLLTEETRRDALSYMEGNFICKDLMKLPVPDTNDILDFVEGQFYSLN